MEAEVGKCSIVYLCTWKAHMNLTYTQCAWTALTPTISTLDNLVKLNTFQNKRIQHCKYIVKLMSYQIEKKKKIHNTKVVLACHHLPLPISEFQMGYAGMQSLQYWFSVNCLHHVSPQQQYIFHVPVTLNLIYSE